MNKLRIVYFDCFSGISGDMSLAALVDAGADRDYVETELQKIRVEPFTLHWTRVNKRGISALKVDVITDAERPPVHHRHYTDIVRIIREAGLSERATALSLAIFEKIGAAEAKIHGIPLERVHFHEIGAIDSIVDIVGVALALDSLQAERIYCSPVPLGSGTVRCDHGDYPVPAPATLEMMKGLPVAQADVAVELTTPTGAGIVSAVADEFTKGLPPMIVDAIGYGAGTRDLPNRPNVLRVVIGKVNPYIAKWSAHHEHLHGEAQHGHHEHHHHHEHGHRHGHGHGHGHRHDHDDDHRHDPFKGQTHYKQNHHHHGHDHHHYGSGGH